jgi:hypothetical protein
VCVCVFFFWFLVLSVFEEGLVVMFGFGNGVACGGASSEAEERRGAGEGGSL